MIRNSALSVVFNLVCMLCVPVVLASNGCNQNGQAQPTTTDGSNGPDSSIEKTTKPDGTIGAPELKSRPRSIHRSGGVLDLTFDNLEFDIEPDEDFERSMLTKEIEELDGKQVILRGFMLADSVFQRDGIEQFVLVRDNQECCFGPGAKVYHNVWVNMNEGKSTEFSFRPFKIEGVLSIRPWEHPQDGKVYSVFHIQAERCKLD